MEKTLDTIKNLECKLACCLEKELENGLDKVDAHEAGMVTDMIKDLAEAKEKCIKAWYYESLIEQMAYDEDDWEGNERMGYPRGRSHSGSRGGRGTAGQPRSASSGRFMRAGDGRSGYMPPMIGDIPDHMMRDGRWSEKGRPYDEFQDARRHYTETRSASDKTRMDQKAKEHVTSSMESIKEIWGDADPQLRMQLKSDLTRMVNDLSV